MASATSPYGAAIVGETMRGGIAVPAGEHDGVSAPLQMLLVPAADPTEEVSHEFRSPRKAARPSASKWSRAISSEAHLDDLKDKLLSVGLVDVSGTRGRRGACGDAHETRPSNGAFATLGSVGAFVARFADEKVRDQARDALGGRMLFIPDVRSEGALPLRHALIPDEVPQRGKEWPPESGIAMAHKAGIHGDNVLAGVLDTGVDADHPVFRRTEIEFRYISPGVVNRGDEPRDVRGFDTDGHGTHVCGILAGARIGVAPKIIPHVAAVIESETLRTSLLRTTYGLDWMVRLFGTSANSHRQAVVNLSLGFERDQLTETEARYVDNVMSRFIRALAATDVLVVAAAGNGGRQGRPVCSPADFKDVLAVGAVDWNGRRAAFSSESPKVAKPDIYGYGVNVLSSFERDKRGRPSYRAFDGTSMAAPYVAGIACLLRCENPRTTAREVREHMLETAIQGDDPLPIAAFAHWS